MSKLQLVIWTTALMSFQISCTKIEPPPDPDDPEINPWKKVEIATEGVIQNAYSTPFALFLITRDHFFRLNHKNEILEKRLFHVSNDYGMAALSDNTLARITKNNSGRLVLEFHLSKTPGEIIQFSSDDLKGNANEIVQFDYFGNSVGAFSGDGSKFLLPTQTFPNYHYSFYLFDIKLDAQTLHFQSVTLERRYEIPEMSTEDFNLSTIRFLDGNFYVASKEGAYKLNINGTVTQITDHWMKDVFAWNGKLYATGFEDADFWTSADNGKTWKRSNTASPLKLVTNTGALLFSQENPGNPFLVMDADFSDLKMLRLNIAFPDDHSAYKNIIAFTGKYYLSVANELYMSTDIKLDE